MKIICFSDLHLEFGSYFTPPVDSDADLMVLAGDIITFSNFKLFKPIVRQWKKPIIFIAGNHEFYTRQPMIEGIKAFRSWIKEHPQVIFLDSESVSIQGIHFFGGTMWTDLKGGCIGAIKEAEKTLNDFQMIKTSKGYLTPRDTLELHKDYKDKLINWFNQDLDGLRVVISHHMPVSSNNHIDVGYNSLDMEEIIHQHKPALWIYGHTHLPDDRIIGQTRIVSNPRGYPKYKGFQCKEYDKKGLINANLLI